MPTFTPDAYYAAFQQRHACCRALLDLTRQQSTLIAADDYGLLLEILESKQSLLDHLGRLSGEQQPLRETWPRERDALGSSDRQRCDAILAETEALLADLLAEEKSASQLLLDRKDATERELRSLASGAQTQSAYQSRPHPAASRLDLNL